MNWKWLFVSIGLLLGGIWLIELGYDRVDEKKEIAEFGASSRGWIEFGQKVLKRKRGHSYELQIHFEDQQGGHHKKLYTVSKSFYKKHVGEVSIIDEHVTILFDPADPVGSAYIDGAREGHPSVTGFAMGIFGFGGIIYTLSQRRPKATEYS